MSFIDTFWITVFAFYCNSNMKYIILYLPRWKICWGWATGDSVDG